MSDSFGIDELEGESVYSFGYLVYLIRDCGVV